MIKTFKWIYGLGVKAERARIKDELNNLLAAKPVQTPHEPDMRFGRRVEIWQEAYRMIDYLLEERTITMKAPSIISGDKKDV